MPLTVKEVFEGGGSEKTKNRSSLSNNKKKDVSLITSGVAGLISGAIKIPEGFMSLGASLIDLGLDTDLAAEVEDTFDKVNIFEPYAEARVSGKITQILTQLGIPATKGAKIASNLANKAIAAKKVDKYADLKVLGAMGDKTKKTLAGAAGAGATGIFATDTDKLGWFADEREGLEGRDEAKRELLNRFKFMGEELVLSTALTGGWMGIKALKKRRRTGTPDDFKIREGVMGIFDKARQSRFIGGATTKELDDLKFQEYTSKIKSTELEIQNLMLGLETQVNKALGKNFIARVTGGVHEKEQELYELINKHLSVGYRKGKVPTDPRSPIQEGRFTRAKKESMEKIKKFAQENGGNPEELESAIKDIRGSIDGMTEEMLELEVKGMPGTKKIAGKLRQRLIDNIGNHLKRTYKAFEIDKNAPFYRFVKHKPTKEQWQNAENYLVHKYKMGEQEAHRYLTDLLEGKAAPAMDKLTSASRQELDDGITALRNDALLKRTHIGKPIREFLGEIKDPRYNAARTMMSMAQLIHRSKFYDEAAELMMKEGSLTQNATDPVLRHRILTGFFKNVEEGGKISLDRKILNKIIKSGKYSAEDINDIIRDPDLLTKDPRFGTLKKTIKGVEYYQPKPEFENLIGKIQSEYQLNSLPNLLEGKYTTKNIADAVMDVKYRVTDPNMKILRDAYYAAILYPKFFSQAMKTVASGITQLRNIQSGVYFTVATGALPFGKTAAKDFAEAAGMTSKEIAKAATGKPLKPQQLERMKYLTELGITGQTVRYGEMQDILRNLSGAGYRPDPDIVRNAYKPVLSVMGRLKEGLLKYPYKVAGATYRWGDDFWRTAIFARYARKFKEAYPNKPIKEIDRMAANRVRDIYPTYDKVPPWIKATRMMPFGTFVSFPAEMVRNVGNLMKYSIDDYTSGIPVLRRQGLSTMFGVSFAMGGAYEATLAGAKLLTNTTEDDIEALRRYVAPWSTNGQLVPVGRDKKGQLNYMDMSYLNPYDTVSRPIKTVIRAIANGEENNHSLNEMLTKGLYEAATKFMTPFTDESISTEAFGDLYSGLKRGRGVDRKTGAIIWREEDPAGEKAYAAVNHLVDAFKPGSTQQYSRFLKSVIKTPDRNYRMYEWQNELPGLIGYRVLKSEPDIGLQYKVTGFNKRISDSRATFSTDIQRKGLTDPKDIVDEYIGAEKSRFNIQSEFYKDLLAAKQLGINNSDYRKTLDRVSEKKALKKIKRGLYEPLKLPKGLGKKMDSIYRDLKETNPDLVNPYPEARNKINLIRSKYRGYDLLDVNPYTFGIPTGRHKPKGKDTWLDEWNESMQQDIDRYGIKTGEGQPYIMGQTGFGAQPPQPGQQLTQRGSQLQPGTKPIPKPKQNITKEKYAGFFPHDTLGQTIAQQKSRTNMYRRGGLVKK